jgi:hypothetical protein
VLPRERLRTKVGPEQQGELGPCRSMVTQEPPESANKGVIP